MISSHQNNTVRRVASLKDKKFRKEHGEYLIEGEKVVKEAVRRRLDIGVILATPEFFRTFEDCGYPVFEISADVAAYCSDEKTAQGVLATVAMPRLKAEKPKGVCVVMDGVKDPGNVGAIIRTCAALNVPTVYAFDCADAFSPKCVRSSMSGIFSVNVVTVTEEEKRELFSDASVIVADMNGDDLFDIEPIKDFCLVIGSESHGVSEFFRKKAKKTVSIPMSDNMESLNAAIAGSVILYQLLKKPL